MTKTLLVGTGGFGKKHLNAWLSLGNRANLYVADVNPAAKDACVSAGLPESNFSTDFRELLNSVDIVDIVTPAQTHFDIASAAILAGRPVFVEKPATATSNEAKALATLVKSQDGFVQVGFQYRHNALTQYALSLMKSNPLAIGDIRFIQGDFLGFKRPRVDVGVTHSDAIHFIDLINYVTNSKPSRVNAVMRDYMARPHSFGGRMDDMALLTLEYEDSGAVALINANYIQPGAANDKIVAGATETKKLLVSGVYGSLEIDYVSERLTVHKQFHEQVEGRWVARNNGTESPRIVVEDPLMVELKAFVRDSASRTPPLCDIVGSGVVPAVVIEKCYESAKAGVPVNIQW